MDTGLPKDDEVDRSQEVDVWWGSYAGRTMLPSFMLCGLLSVGVVVGAYYLHIRYGFDRLTLRYCVYTIVAAMWFGQLARWAYRVMTFSYRLTTHRLLLERNFFNSARAAVGLQDITAVRVERPPLERVVGVGRVQVVSEKDPLLELRGLREPETIAAVIRGQVNRVRAIKT
jgi:hypothetical protein